MKTHDRGAAVAGPLRDLLEGGAAGGLGDGELLGRFAGRDGQASESAFAALVDRHGPMVLRACRAILGDPHRAEDAFQATFLLLSRRAGSLWVRDSLAPWLHAVACRVAVGARGRRRPSPGPGATGRVAGLPLAPSTPRATTSGRPCTRRSSGSPTGSAPRCCSATSKG